MESWVIDQNDLTDAQLKQLATEAILAGVSQITTLPSYLPRLKMLTRQQIALRGLADYPLGQGTLAKQAFEVAQLFQQGAASVAIVLPPQLLSADPAVFQTFQETLVPLALAWGELLFLVSTKDLKELAKITAAQRLRELGIRRVILCGETAEDLLHDVSIFRLDGGADLVIEAHGDESVDPEAFQAQGGNRLHVIRRLKD